MKTHLAEFGDQYQPRRKLRLGELFARASKAKNCAQQDPRRRECSSERPPRWRTLPRGAWR